MIDISVNLCKSTLGPRSDEGEILSFLQLLDALCDSGGKEECLTLLWQQLQDLTQGLLEGLGQQLILTWNMLTADDSSLALGNQGKKTTGQETEAFL